MVSCFFLSAYLPSLSLGHGCANHGSEGKCFKFPHPLLWRNEASLPDQRRTMYFPLALFAYTVCIRRTEQCFSVLRTHKSDAVDGSSRRRYVTDQWHNVPLLRARGLGLTPPGTYKPNVRGSNACRGSNSVWTRTLDRYTRAGLPNCVFSTMSGPPPKTTQDRTQTKDRHPIPGQKLKCLIPPGIEPGSPGWKAGTLPTTPRRRVFSGFHNLKIAKELVIF